MRKLFQTINKGEFETVKQIILRQPEVVNNKSVGLLKRDEGQTPLRIAVKNSFPKMTMLFVENDADLNAYTSEDDMYIIHQAIYTVIQYACSGKIHLRDREFKEKGIVSDYTQNLYDEDKQLFDISYSILEYLIKQGIDLSVKTKWEIVSVTELYFRQPPFFLVPALMMYHRKYAEELKKCFLCFYQLK